jgi:SET domain-containing protein
MNLTSHRSPRTAVRPSPIGGRGLFAAAPIASGEIVCVKGGRLIDRAALDRLRPVVRDAELAVADGLYLAPTTPEEFEDVMMFLNHSCEPNVGIEGQIVFVALRDVAVGEELTLDYATVDREVVDMNCRCGAAGCRGVITGRDWQDPTLQRKYGDHFAWYLLRDIRARRRA